MGEGGSLFTRSGDEKINGNLIELLKHTDCVWGETSYISVDLAVLMQWIIAALLRAR